MTKDVQLYLRAVEEQGGPTSIGTVTASVWQRFADRRAGRRLHPHLSVRRGLVRVSKAATSCFETTFCHW